MAACSMGCSEARERSRRHDGEPSDIDCRLEAGSSDLHGFGWAGKRSASTTGATAAADEATGSRPLATLAPVRRLPPRQVAVQMIAALLGPALEAPHRGRQVLRRLGQPLHHFAQLFTRALEAAARSADRNAEH